MKIRTLLVDSSYLLKRSFHGAKETYTNSFGHIGGLYSFFTTLRKLIKEHKANKVILAWDGENGGVYRYYIDKEYKSNRKDKTWNEKIEMTDAELQKEKEKEESILKQRKRIQAYAEELFIRQIEIEDIEGDDLIASYCMRYHEDEDIILYSNDRDFAQLLDLNITIVFSNIDIPITKFNFLHYFNYHYSNALTVKIICGDSADNIKGIKGVKEKTLIKYFPELLYKKLTVREICQKARQINNDRIKENKKPLKVLDNIINGIDRLKVNHKLINLRKPFLNEQANNELGQLEMPLSPEGRSSKNLYNMMIEDEFFTVYKSTFVNYIEPFYSVIMGEKQLLKEFNDNNKENL
jgi:5'-3' exonuclease